MNFAVRTPRIAAPGMEMIVESIAVTDGAAVQAGDPLMQLRLGALSASLQCEASGVARDLRVAPGDTLIPDRILLWIERAGPPPPDLPAPNPQLLPDRPADPHEIRFQLPRELLRIRTPIVQKVLVRADQKVQPGAPLLEVLLPPIKLKWSGDAAGQIAEVLVKPGDLLAEGTPILRLAGGKSAANPVAAPASLARFEIPELTLAEFRRTTHALRKPVEELAKLVAAAGLVNSAALMRTEMSKLAACRFTIAVVGEFKRGKSTFLNALAGGEFLPNDVVPCTAFACRFQYRERPQLALIEMDGTETALPLQTIPEIVAELNRLTADPQTSIREAIVRLPIELCRDGLDLIDTPGLNDSEAMNRVTLSVLPSVDAAVLLLIPESPFSETERRFLEDHLLGKDIGRVLFVLSAKDRVPPAQLGRLSGYIEGQIHRVLTTRGQTDLSGAQLLPISSREELKNPGDPSSGFTQLRQHLNHLIFQERGRLLLMRILQRIRSVAADSKAAIQLRQLEIASSRESLQASLRDRERQIANSRLYANELRLRVMEAQAKAESASLVAAERLHRALLAMRESLPPLIPADILKSGAEQIRAELGSLLQQNAGRIYQKALTALLAEIDEIYGPITRSVRAFIEQATPRSTAPLEAPQDRPEFSGGLVIRIDLSLGALSWLYLAESAQSILSSGELASSIEARALTRLREDYGQEIERQVHRSASEPLLSAQFTEFVRRPFSKLIHRLDRELRVRLADATATLESLRKPAAVDGSVADPRNWTAMSQGIEDAMTRCESLISEKGKGG